MYIAILDMTVAPQDRPSVLAHFAGAREEVRVMPGNLEFRALASYEDPGALTVLHEWADEQSFTAYLASGAFARSGERVRPLMTAAPMSRRFHAELAEAVR